MGNVGVHTKKLNSKIRRNKKKMVDFLKALNKRAESNGGIVWVTPEYAPKVISKIDVESLTFTYATAPGAFFPGLATAFFTEESRFHPSNFDGWFPVFSQQFYQLEHIKLWETL